VKRNKYRLYYWDFEKNHVRHGYETTSFEKITSIRDNLLPKYGCECCCHIEMYIPNYFKKGGVWFDIGTQPGHSPYICTCGKMWQYPAHRPKTNTETTEVKNEGRT